TPPPKAGVVADLQTGLRFTPPPASAGAVVGPFDPAGLIMPLGGGYLPLGDARDPISAPTFDAGSLGRIATTLQAPPAAQQELLAALQTLGAAPPSSAPLTALGAKAGHFFTQPPLL